MYFKVTALKTMKTHSCIFAIQGHLLSPGTPHITKYGETVLLKCSAHRSSVGLQNTKELVVFSGTTFYLKHRGIESATHSQSAAFMTERN